MLQLRCTFFIQHLKSLVNSICLLVLLSIAAKVANAQVAPDSIPQQKHYFYHLERHISLLTGLNGFRHNFAEVGFALNQYGRVGHHPTAWAYFISSEIKLDNQLLLGPKVGAWIGGGIAGIALGINTICYTDLAHTAWRIRPEIGMGFDRWKVVYGFNFAVTNRNFSGVPKNVISLVYLFGLFKVKTIEG